MAPSVVSFVELAGSYESNFWHQQAVNETDHRLQITTIKKVGPYTFKSKPVVMMLFDTLSWNYANWYKSAMNLYRYLLRAKFILKIWCWSREWYNSNQHCIVIVKYQFVNYSQCIDVATNFNCNICSKEIPLSRTSLQQVADSDSSWAVHSHPHLLKPTPLSIGKQSSIQISQFPNPQMLLIWLFAQLLDVLTYWSLLVASDWLIWTHTDLVHWSSYSSTSHTHGWGYTSEWGSIRRKQIARWLYLSRMKNVSYCLSKNIFG